MAFNPNLLISSGLLVVLVLPWGWLALGPTTIRALARRFGVVSQATVVAFAAAKAGAPEHFLTLQFVDDGGTEHEIVTRVPIEAYQHTTGENVVKIHYLRLFPVWPSVEHDSRRHT